jgi:two-component system chemotaxis response regulator CheB
MALSASMGGIDALMSILGDFPQNCPPTVVCLQAEPMVVDSFIKRLDTDLKCSVKAAKDGAPLNQGTIHIAADPDRHVVVEPGTPPKIRLMERDPIEGVRPSANLLFGSIARASIPAVGAVLTGMGSDGAKGLKLMRDGGCDTFAQDPASAMVAEAPTAAIELGAAGTSLGLDHLGNAVLSCCSMH